jgi:hypothetical protein
VAEQKPLKTGSSDKHAEGQLPTGQQKVMDTAKLGLAPEKMDRGTLSRDAARDETIKD